MAIILCNHSRVALIGHRLGEYRLVECPCNPASEEGWGTCRHRFPARRSVSVGEIGRTSARSAAHPSHHNQRRWATVPVRPHDFHFRQQRGWLVRLRFGRPEYPPKATYSVHIRCSRPPTPRCKARRVSIVGAPRVGRGPKGSMSGAGLGEVVREVVGVAPAQPSVRLANISGIRLAYRRPNSTETPSETPRSPIWALAR
jgi:hypothetical protein